MARPRKPVDLEKLKYLASIQCTYAEMSAVLDISHDQLELHYKDLINSYWEQGKMSLRRKAYQMAMAGDAKVLDKLLKHYLKMQDTNITNVQVNLGSTQKEELELLKAEFIKAFEIKQEKEVLQIETNSSDPEDSTRVLGKEEGQ